jgi:hypothetical protein
MLDPIMYLEKCMLSYKSADWVWQDALHNNNNRPDSKGSFLSETLKEDLGHWLRAGHE